MIKRCGDCGKEKPTTEFHRLYDAFRPECKSCASARKKKYEREHPYEHRLNRMAAGIIKRVSTSVHNPKNRTYITRGIKCLLGENMQEVRKVLHENFEEDIRQLLANGYLPSVDRIDPFGHYELGNIQIISLEENLSRSNLRPRKRKVVVEHTNGTKMQFDSVLDASKALGIKRDTIYSGAAKPGSNKRGLLFEIKEAE